MPKVCRILVFFFCFMAFIVLSGNSQITPDPDLYQIRHIGVDDGLSQGSVYHILKDSKGFMWFSSYEGLNRYDGETMEVFYHNPFDPNGIKGSVISGIVEDHFGRIWVGTEQCINVYDPQSNHFSQIFTLDSLHNPISNSSFAIAADSSYLYAINTLDGIFKINLNTLTKSTINDQVYFRKNNNIKNPAVLSRYGQIWVRLENGIHRIDLISGTKHSYFSDQTDNIFGLPKFFYSIVEIDFNTILLAEENSVFEFSLNTKHIDPIISPEDSILRISEVLLEQDSNLWIGTHEQGLYHLNRKTKKITRLNNQRKDALQLPLNATGNLYLDREDKILWISTDPNGVCALVPNLKPVQKYTGFTFDNIELESMGIRCFAERQDKKIWIGTQEQGIWLFDPQNQEIEMILNTKTYPGFQSTHASILHIDKKQRLWIGTYQGLYLFNNKTIQLISPTDHTVEEKTIWGFVEDQEGILYFSTDNGVFWIDPNSLKTNKLPIIENSTSGRLIITKQFLIIPENNHGIHQIKLSDWKNDSNIVSKHLLPSINLKDAAIARDGKSSWLATTTGIIHCSTLSENLDSISIFKHLNTSNGLPSQYVYCVMEDDSGYIWASTNRGICRIDPKDYAVSNLSTRHNLQGLEFNTNAFITTSDGQMYFGGVQGFNILNPNQFRFETNVDDKVILTKYQLNSKSSINLFHKGESSMSSFLQHDENSIRFYYSYPDYTSNTDLVYQYKLKNYSQNWESSTENSKYYNNLLPGEYIFHVKLKGANQANMSSFSFTILKPWYKSTPAYLGYIIAFAGGLILIYHYYLRTAIMKERIKKSAELSTLKSKFFTQITHDFRTPLTIIKAANHRITGHRQEKYLIDNSSEDLIQMLDQITDLNKFNAGELKLNCIQSDLVDFIRKTIIPIQDIAAHQKKSLKIQSDIEHLEVDFDPHQMKRVLNNLITNALKFTGKGDEIRIGMSVKNQSNVSILFTDTGTGMNKETLRHAFDMYYSFGGDRQIEGTGIGLAYVKQIVELMGGSVIAKSKLGHGSQFELLLPITNKAPKASCRDNSQNFIPLPNSQHSFIHIHSDKEKPIILIAEDNDQLRYLMVESLNKTYDIISAENGLLALRKCTKYLPDLVITDIMMPEMNGYELCRRIKGDVNTNHIPVLMLTAKSDVNSRIKGIHAGADGYLIKPFEEEEFIIRIQQLIDSRKILKEKYREFISLSPHEEHLDSKQIKYLQEANHQILQHIGDVHFNVNDLAKLLNTNHVTLNKKIKYLTGLTTAVYIKKYRLNYAYQLIRDTDLKLSEVAYTIGISDPAYFTKMFKAEFHILPSKLR